ncbi:sarcosine oxidase subunit gamma [Defluviimonas sp. WL0050]|uniref:Sarcosine oxidase subunit gamma n=1 Tax=Albidovulum litorale TaxID=2984134 RepID=A0ABT2ZR48_9RHOB|nr:sarcosine oxidase subunit gamma [Defluviimonas sp. WL0050]MCV2873608.1 sarcosine oxidase subunit gamma [Defluviimonas sp. WL0050]
MPSLIAKSACDGLLPLSEGGVTLSEAAPARVTSVAPFAGQEKATDAALKTMGLGWPKPGQSFTKDEAQILWTGRGQAFLISASPAELDGVAALSDQSDGWARIRLEGAGAEAVLARLVPLDLRTAAFPTGSVARTGLNHMMMVLHRAGAETFDIMVFRSMTASAVHELHHAMKALAARAAAL